MPSLCGYFQQQAPHILEGFNFQAGICIVELCEEFAIAKFFTQRAGILNEEM
jgi:hypothetical protein